MIRPTVLILGSKEGLKYAEKLQTELTKRFRNTELNYDCVVWSDDSIWENGEVTLTSLIHQAQTLGRMNGFAITLFTPDDKISLRDNTYYCSRDNVWLEYGLFAGIMGTSRVFALCPTNPVTKDNSNYNWRKPSDFQQYEIKYSYNDLLELSIDSLEKTAVKIADRIYRMFPPTSTESTEPNPTQQLFKRSY